MTSYQRCYLHYDYMIAVNKLIQNNDKQVTEDEVGSVDSGVLGRVCQLSIIDTVSTSQREPQRESERISNRKSENTVKD